MASGFPWIHQVGLEGSLGAAVALGVARPLRHLYGTPRDHVLGLTMVSGDGRVLRWGGRVVKNVAGFDLTRLSVGSWGSLGVITSVSARLFPIPESDVTLVCLALERRAAACRPRPRPSPPYPLPAVELVDPLRFRRVRRWSSGLSWDPGPRWRRWRPGSLPSSPT